MSRSGPLHPCNGPVRPHQPRKQRERDMSSKTVAARLASLVQARANCEKSGNAEWLARHTDALVAIERNHLPHGSGIDNGVTVDLDASSSVRLVLRVPFHCMDPNGFYDGWREYRVVVRPAFDGITVDVHGRDYNGLKEYLGGLFHHALTLAIDS